MWEITIFFRLKIENGKPKHDKIHCCANTMEEELRAAISFNRILLAENQRLKDCYMNYAATLHEMMNMLLARLNVKDAEIRHLKEEIHIRDHYIAEYEKTSALVEVKLDDLFKVVETVRKKRKT